MKSSVKTALGGMCVAVSVALMLVSSVIPFMIYTIPGVASLLILFMMTECNKKWSFGVYVCTCLVSLMIVPEKEAVAIYIGVLGYYPILKTFIDKIKPRVLNCLVKIIFFLAVAAGTYYILIKVFGISSEMIEESERFLLPVLVVLGTVAFLLYDRVIMLFEAAYLKKWQKNIQKLLKKH